ncbi:MAG: MFS transporter [Deltaproteobacteria bacterium]|nr:MAG: MFS transporter [Deltaproteobacteria bacterium]
MNPQRARATLAASCLIHFLHDGCSDLLYVLFPVWAREFSLSFAQVGLLRTGYSGALALFQVPAGYLADRWGEPRLLAAGTFLTAVGFFCVGTAGGFVPLLVFLMIGGLGSSTQHPLGSSLVSRAYEAGRRRVAIGTYNFSGDLGKVTWPAGVAFVTAWAGWRWAAQGIGLVVLVTAVGIFFLLAPLVDRPAGPQATPAAGRAGNGWGIRDARGFSLLSTIHAIDNGSRTVFLTFLPFLLLGKGMRMDLMWLALGVTFAGGATGKFVCGHLAERWGIIRTVLVTETATGFGILLLLVLPVTPAMFLLPILGIALNGTSSVLYGTVAELVAPERRSRVYGLFYTIGIGTGALTPPLFGLLSDAAGVTATMSVLAMVTLATLPLAHLLRPAVEGSPPRIP